MTGIGEKIFRVTRFGLSLLSLMVGISNLGYSQSETIEKLKNELQATDEDTSKSRALYLLTYEFFDFSLDSALHYARQNLILTYKSEYPKFEVNALSTLGNTFIYLSMFDSAQYYLGRRL